ncbi:tRNA CCA-pyrophosphorylase [Buchnera aphidicola (Mindarus keteleerifoliae)]|uniref:tRNA CCA-pyrophosphorylase n=1 Tax=Buchnera aphidicola TaxID=9 RepID=UPI0031B6BAE9
MKIYLVGGAVRDKLLNLPIKDKDWVVVGATPEILLKKKYQQVGKSFPVFLHPETSEEYALARVEKKEGLGYSGFSTFFSPNISLKQDLKRRDLTINAIAQDIKGNLIDPFNGIKDLKNRLLKHVSSAFCEDPLRILRVARFAANLAHLGFIVSEDTMKIMSKMVDSKELMYLSSERIWIETKKALKTKNPHVFFEILKKCKALSIIFPEIDKVAKIHYFFSSVLVKNYQFNLLLILAKISKNTKDISIKFSCIFSLLNNIIYSENLFFFQKFDFFSATLTKKMCDRLKIPKYIQDFSVLISGFFGFLRNLNLQKEEKIIYFLNRMDVWRKPIRIKQISFLIKSGFIFFELNNFKSNNYCFFLSKYLYEIFIISSKVSVKSIIEKGITGSDISIELNRLRIAKIKKWKKKNYQKYFF